MDLISVHVPKCAGTALREALIAAYGADQVYLDSADRLLDPQAAINTRREEFLNEFHSQRDTLLAGKRVAHGHLYMRKYDGIDAPRVTILRHPVDRFISHYFFWLHCPPHGHSLHDLFLAERPALTDFAKWPGLANLYRDVLFGGVDMATFDLVGLTEQMDQTLARMEKLIGRKLHVETRNENSAPHYQRHRAEILQNPRIVSKLRDALHDDIDFYERYAAVG